MADENKIRDAADAVKGIVEAVPVYQDALQPAAKEIGAALQKVTKAIHVALAPISALVWGYEKIAEYLDKALTEKLKKVPPERIVMPSPSVAGPTIEALRFVAHEPTLRELYANLLATAMDADTAISAHPAFVEIIRQLTPHEARLISHMATSLFNPVLSGGISLLINEEEAVMEFRHYSLLDQEIGLEQEIQGWPIGLTLSYLDNLMRLGLAEILPAVEQGDISQSKYPLIEERAKAVVTNIVSMQGAGGETKVSSLEIKDIRTSKELIRLTALGHQFHSVCMGSPESNQAEK
ncbi:MAG: hypothetical protein V7641_809 [Blastocatellia bacterium]